jgi:hypothetical protein
MENDGNCFFRFISDQLDHDHGAGHEYIRYQINNHICRNGDEFKDILSMQDDDKEITDLDSYLHKMRQNGEWGGPPEVYAASWFYKVDITIYSKEYVGTGGSLIFKADDTKGDSKKPLSMWHISYHDNNHYNSVRPMESMSANVQEDNSNIDWYEANMQRTLDEHGQDCIKLQNKAAGSGNHADPDEIKTICAITLSTMMYIANRLSETGGRKITEPQLQTMCIQAEAWSVISAPQLTVKETKQKSAHPTVPRYEDQLQEVMETYRESVLHLLKQGQTMYLLSNYEKLRSEHFPIMTGIATLIQHLGGNEISIKSLAN